MRKQHLEARVLELVDWVERGRAVEDDRIELKAQWPTDLYRAARQIAGLANASRASSVLWIVGLDERGGVVESLDPVEVSQWWAQVARHFDEEAPGLQCLIVPTGGEKYVVALQFETERAPYLVNTLGGGRIEREAPWREGNSTRTAHRHELLRAVVAQARVPELELVRGNLSIRGVDPYSGSGDDDTLSRVIELNASVFISAEGESVLPQHRQSWTIELDGHEPRPMLVQIGGPFSIDRTRVAGEQFRTEAGIIQVLDDRGLVVRGSAEVQVNGRTYLSCEEVDAWETASWIDLAASLPLDRSSLSATLRARFVPTATEVPDWDPVTEGAVTEFRADL